MENEQRELLCGIIEKNINRIKKIVFSKATDPSVIKCEAKPVMLKGNTCFSLETFDKSGKAFHQNIELSEAPEILSRMAFEKFRQTNILTGAGECALMISKKGKATLINNIKEDAPEVIPTEHDRKKRYIIDSSEHSDFLSALGVCDEKGRVFDKKKAKYRQINRFVELLSDVYDALPKEGTLTVCDLCCGKSYLTFAVYYYLTKICGREVMMYGVDLKADVIEYCTEVAEKLGCQGLKFIASDIAAFKTENTPDLVISLHACDTATDIVLAYAVRRRAKVILSTPCCHHEMNHTMHCSELAFIEKHSILRQKFCDAATDALRALRLESEGYKVEAIELIDPEETPKNVMIRAIRHDKILPGKREAALNEYNAACRLLGVTPTLDKLLKE